MMQPGTSQCVGMGDAKGVDLKMFEKCLNEYHNNVYFHKQVNICE